MSRDGLLPPIFSRLHKKFSTPVFDILIIGAAISLIGAFLPIGFIAQMANIGTLSAFTAVAIGVIVLRKKKPDLSRPFRMPWVPFLPILSAVMDNLLSRGKFSREQAEYMHAFIITGCVGVVQKWLDEEMAQPSRQMAEMLVALSLGLPGVLSESAKPI